jgi:hopanoid biosynthesis associated protein HpnK
MSARLIVTADDFGMSLEVNEAVEEAHRDGILTCASLVVAGEAAEDAVRRAKRLPGLGVGLHLAVFGARASAKEPSLLAPDGVNLGERPVSTGSAIMVLPSARRAARREIAAQFEAYRKTGLALGHLDGHWHAHQHPTVIAQALEIGLPLGLKALRVPYEPYGFSRRVASREGKAGARLAHAVFGLPLTLNMRRLARRSGIATNDYFFGKIDDGFITEELLVRLIGHLPEGATELGLHPATTTWRGEHCPPAHWRQAGELAALTSPRVREAVERRAVKLIRWADLA